MNKTQWLPRSWGTQSKGILKFKHILVPLATKDVPARQSCRKEFFTGHAERPALQAESPAFVWLQAPWSLAYVPEPLLSHQTRSLLKPDPLSVVPLVILQSWWERFCGSYEHSECKLFRVGTISTYCVLHPAVGAQSCWNCHNTSKQL